MAKLKIKTDNKWRNLLYGYELPKGKRTDNKWRNLLYGYELPKGKRKDFDYLAEEELDCRDFIKYRGVYYDLGEFLRIPTTFPEEMKKWDRYTSDSYFSGVVIKYSEDRNQVKIGTYFS